MVPTVARILPDRMLGVVGVSQDGRWVIAGAQSPDEDHPVTIKAFALDGSASVLFCFVYCPITWDPAGKFVYLSLPELQERTYIFPVTQGVGLPKILPAGIKSVEDLANEKSIPWLVESALSPSVYAYTRVNTRRNLYRIPLP